MSGNAHEIAEAVRRGESSAAAEVEAALERADASQHLNIFTRIDADGALARAAQIDAMRNEGSAVGPLCGVPFVVKDLIDQKGLPNTCGASFAPFTPAASARCVSLLESAGAVAVGRVGLHEFAFGFSSENPWFGPVRNPLDPSLSTGGSSGGSAAAVAAGIVPLALGTDTGGSVRVPAALCGIVGLKVTHGRGSTRGVYPLAPGLDTVGPLTATVADAALAYSVIGVHDPDDPASVDVPLEAPPDPPDPSQLRLAIPHPWVATGYERRVEAAFAELVARLRGLGIAVDDVEAPVVAPPGLGLASAYYEAAAVHRTRFQADRDAYGPDLQVRFDDAFAVTEAEYEAALEWRSDLRAAMAAALASYDALLTPTVAALTKPIGVDTLDLTTGPTHYRAPLSHFTALVNNAGLPALSLPIPGTGNPPLAIQLVGPAWGEAGLLAAGATIEETTAA